MKAMLPRRESERRSHALARHCDILSAVETRMSMLSMTYMKFIETGLCCFIPGKVIDEVDRILTLVETSDAPLRTHELLQELRDISSMAMEHFDENILPSLRHKMDLSSFSFPLGPSTSAKSSHKVIVVQHTVADELNKVKKQTKNNKQKMTAFAALLNKTSKKTKRQAKLISEQTKKIQEQEARLQEQGLKIQEQEVSIADLKKHMDEWDQKFSDLTSELIRAREELNKKAVPSSTPPRTERCLPDVHVLGRLLDFGRKKFDLDLKKRKSTLISDIPSKILRRLPIDASLGRDKGDSRINQTCGEDISSKIQDNITNNISKIITKSFGSEKEKLPKRSRLGPFLSESIETIIKGPITNIKSRKRRISEPLE